MNETLVKIGFYLLASTIPISIASRISHFKLMNHLRKNYSNTKALEEYSESFRFSLRKLQGIFSKYFESDIILKRYFLIVRFLMWLFVIVIIVGLGLFFMGR